MVEEGLDCAVEQFGLDMAQGEGSFVGAELDAPVLVPQEIAYDRQPLLLPRRVLAGKLRQRGRRSFSDSSDGMGEHQSREGMQGRIV